MGIEFINEIDDEELPPGIGIRFRYLERSYVLLSDFFFPELDIH